MLKILILISRISTAEMKSEKVMRSASSLRQCERANWTLIETWTTRCDLEKIWTVKGIENGMAIWSRTGAPAVNGTVTD